MHLDMISYLLSHAGASVRLKDNKGDTALDTLLRTMSLCDWASRARAGGWDSYTVANTIMALTGNDPARLWELPLHNRYTDPAGGSESGQSNHGQPPSAEEVWVACERNALCMAVRLGDSLVSQYVCTCVNVVIYSLFYVSVSSSLIHIRIYLIKTIL